MKKVIFKKDFAFWSLGSTTTLDDTLADQLIKNKTVSLAPSSQPEPVEGQTTSNPETPAE